MANTIEIQGFPHRYELSPPTDFPGVLVFVHGWLLSRAYWQPIIERLSPFYQCLTYDLRGFGESQAAPGPDSVAELSPVGAGIGAAGVSASASQASASQAGASQTNQSQLDRQRSFNQSRVSPTAQYTPATYARDLGLLLQRLNLQNAWLIGHSLGGSIALWAADQAPETVAGVICINSGGGIYLKEEFERFRTVGQLLVKLRPRWLSRWPLLGLPCHLPFCYLNVAQPVAAVWARQRLLDLLSAEAEAALGALLDSTTEAEVHRLPQVVARLQQPVHFIAGANDMLMEPKYVHHLASFHPSFEFCGNNVSEITNCGHLAMIEQPEAVSREIKTILATYSQA